MVSNLSHLGRIATFYLFVTALNYIIALDKRMIRVRIGVRVKNLLGLGLLKGDAVVLASVYGQVINVIFAVSSLFILILGHSDWAIPLLRFTLFMYGPTLGATTIGNRWQNDPWERIFAKAYPIGAVVMLILGLPYAFPQITLSVSIIAAVLLVGTTHYSIKMLRRANLLIELDL